MKQYIKIILPFVILLLSGCEKGSETTYATVEIERNGLREEVIVKFPANIPEGSKIDLYWDIDIDREAGFGPLYKEEANYMSAIYDGKQVTFSILPWSHITAQESKEYVLRIEVIASAHEITRAASKKITPPLIPIVDIKEVKGGKIFLEGKIHNNGYADQIIEHGFYLGNTRSIDFDMDNIKQTYEKIASNDPTSFFSTHHELTSLKDEIRAYAYAKTPTGEIFSDCGLHFIRGSRIILSTSSDFTGLTHEKATVYGNAYFEDNESDIFSIVEKGFCYINTREITTGRMPNIKDGRLILEGGEGNFSGTITGLTPGAAYKVAAYAINNSDKVFYSKSYVTLPMYLSETFVPRCSIIRDYPDDPNITGEIVLKGAITDENEYSVTERGFCYTTNGRTPTINDNKLPSGAGIGDFTETINNLPAGIYTFKSYGINDAGVGYSYGYYQIKIE